MTHPFTTSLTTLDYLVIAIPLLIVLAISFTMRRYTKSVADFLAANRCAGRYLICSAQDELNAAVVGTVGTMEVFAKTGTSLNFWSNFAFLIFFFFSLFGVITYRFRETRCLTFHQFLETRYSKGLRVFTSSINIFSGMINFGLIPAVGGRFFVYFCGLPEEVTVAGITMRTFAVIMVVLMAMSLIMATTGGQISVMVTDCVEGLISGAFYVTIALFIVLTISISQMKGALLSGAPGKSFINPFDVSGQEDFNASFLIIGVLFNLYIFRGSAWTQGFNAAAKTAHEGVMAGILSTWRKYAALAMVSLVSIGAFTLLHHPDFASQRMLVEAGLKNVHPAQLQGEMSMPLALGLLLIPGIKGAFCAIGIFGIISSQGMQLHSYGATLLQDAILPLVKKQLSPKTHLLALRLTMMGVALFVCTFSLLYKPVEYLVMMTMLIGAIYLGGVGAIVWGGLYWKKGTTAGAWTSMIIGSVLAVLFNVLQQFWTQLAPLAVRLVGPGGWAVYLNAHAEKFPVNGTKLTITAMGCSLIGYVVVSLLTSKENFNLERMLHRGLYAIKGETEPVEPIRKGFAWGKLIGINERFSWGDKVLSTITFCWVMSLNLFAGCVLLWRLLVDRLSDEWWFDYTLATTVWIPLVVGIITTIWFTIGTIKDILDLLKTLKVAKHNDSDDGTVRDHRNLGEPV